MEVNDLFARARIYAPDEAGWSDVRSSSGMRMSHVTTPQGVPLLRAQYELPASIQEALVLARPDVFVHPRRTEFDTHLEECGITEIFSPGDAIVWVRPRLSATMRRLASLAGAVRGRMNRADSDELNPLFAKTRLRMVMRRDVPHPGQLTVVAAPLHPDTGELIEDWGMMMATVVVVKPHTDASQIQITQVQMRTWKATYLLPIALGKHHGMFEVFLVHRESQAFQEAITLPGSYVVVGMRRYHRGAPLLPKRSCGAGVTTDPADWDQADGDSFIFAEYLQDFCGRLGLELEAWSSLDGRRLVKFQAAVRKDAWDQAWSFLECAFRTHRAAYRRLLGGADAPGLVFQEPRFPEVASSEETRGASTKPLHGVPEHKTFVHYQEQSTLSLCPGMRRSCSEPSLDPLSC